MVNLDMRNMQDHHPRRDDQVAAWLRDRREANSHGGAYDAIDMLLDEYREAADTGMSLEEVVNGREDVQLPRATKKKREI